MNKPEPITNPEIHAAQKVHAGIGLKKPEPITETEIVKCLASTNCLGTVRMSYESGPYDLDRLSVNASKFVEAIVEQRDAHWTQLLANQEPEEERITFAGDWRPYRDAIDSAYKRLGRVPEKNGFPKKDWNLAVAVYEFAIENSPELNTKCWSCEKKVKHFNAFRCFDCKATLCEDCALPHFGPNHSVRAKLAHADFRPMPQLNGLTGASGTSHVMPEPDAYCVTAPDGACTSTDPRCMHQSAKAKLRQDYESLIDEYVNDYEMEGEASDGSPVCYKPTKKDRALLKDALMGFDFSMLFETAPPAEE